MPETEPLGNRTQLRKAGLSAFHQYLSMIGHSGQTATPLQAHRQLKAAPKEDRRGLAVVLNIEYCSEHRQRQNSPRADDCVELLPDATFPLFSWCRESPPIDGSRHEVEVGANRYKQRPINISRALCCVIPFGNVTVMSALFLLAALFDSQAIACHDSLAVPDQATESDDAMSCLSGFLWTPAAFVATMKPAAASGFDWGLSFPSPRSGPGGDIFVEWRMARQNGVVCEDERPAVIVVHESGRGMHAGRAIAQALSRTGIHTFMVHLPGYGQRSVRRPDQGKELVEGIRAGCYGCPQSGGRR